MSQTFSHPAAGDRESAGATAARERGLRPLSEITRPEIAAAARTADCETPTKAQIREALSDSACLAEWHHIERSGRIKREFFTTASAAVEAVKIKRRQGDLVAQMIEEQRRLGAIK